jgi:hypothetical protein
MSFIPTKLTPEEAKQKHEQVLLQFEEYKQRTCLQLIRELEAQQKRYIKMKKKSHDEHKKVRNIVGRMDELGKETPITFAVKYLPIEEAVQFRRIVS